MIKTVIISRIDNIGDVVLTLPMAGALKKYLPEVKIIFLGKNYTQAIIQTCIHIDLFVNYDDLMKLPWEHQIKLISELKADAILHVLPHSFIAKLAKKANIPLRIGTNHRIYNWLYCNKLISLSRKKSNLHEAQLNLQLLKPIIGEKHFQLKEISSLYGMEKISSLKSEFEYLIDKQRINVILHPKSKGSAREWGTENFTKLIDLLPQDKYKIFITGTETEKLQISEFLSTNTSKIVDLTGKMSLAEMISFIAKADVLVAASTGVLHIAAALNSLAIGLYAPMRPIFPTRWAPIGKLGSFLVVDKNCNQCKKNMNCQCIRDIQPIDVVNKINNLYPMKSLV